MERSGVILCDEIDEQSCSANSSAETDPLELSNAQGALTTNLKFHRVNSIVFADPLNNYPNEENSSKDHEDNNHVTIINNLLIRKDTGRKYNKYQFNGEDKCPTSCPEHDCLRTFPTRNKLVAHIRRVHRIDRSRYMCEQCGRGFPERNMLRRHALTHSGRTLECPICGVKLSLSTSLSRHLTSHSNLRPHQCEVCKKTFARASTKVTHVKFVHREGLFQCDECDKRFSSRKQWSLHVTAHRKET